MAGFLAADVIQSGVDSGLGCADTRLGAWHCRRPTVAINRTLIPAQRKLVSGARRRGGLCRGGSRGRMPAAAHISGQVQLVSGRLEAEQAGVGAVGCQQLAVAALLRDPAVFDDHYPVGVASR